MLPPLLLLRGSSSILRVVVGRKAMAGNGQRVYVLLVAVAGRSSAAVEVWGIRKGMRALKGIAATRRHYMHMLRKS